MAQVDEVLRGLFMGVSRQAMTLRLPGQLDDAENVLFSVLDGGFRKRAGTEFVALLPGPTSRQCQGYVYRRDPQEAYVVVVTDGDLWVYGLDGTPKTVAFPDGKGYLAAGGSGRKFRFVTVGDYTLVLNTEVVVAMTEGVTAGTFKGSKQTFDELPTSGVSAGDIYEIIGTGGNGFLSYYVRATAASPSEDWQEAADPGLPNEFDAATMPHALVRQADGTFKFMEIVWGRRTVGNAVTVPTPEFVGRPIADITYHRSRLVLAAGEHVWCSATGDIFNFWATKTTTVVDSDPFGRTASTRQVNDLRVLVPFHKVLFASSQLQQFEMTADGVLTPKTAVLDDTTSYAVNPAARPAVMGDALYLAAEANRSGRLLEYAINTETLTMAANDVAEHVQGFLLAPFRALHADPSQQMVFVLREAATQELYVWRTYTLNQERKQSAWARWTLPGEVIDATVLDGYLYLLTWADNALALERLNLGDETNRWATHEIALGDGRYFQPRLDRRVSVTGVYNAGTDITTWTLPYPHRGVAELVLGSGWPEAGMALAVTRTATHTLTHPGNYGGQSCIVGLPYTQRARLSDLFPHDDQQRVVAAGRTNVAKLDAVLRDSGYLRIEVTPPQRPTKAVEWTGRAVGSAANRVGRPAVPAEGFLSVIVAGPPQTRIELVNPTHWPTVVTELRWRGQHHKGS